MEPQQQDVLVTEPLLHVVEVELELGDETPAPFGIIAECGRVEDDLATIGNLQSATYEVRALGHVTGMEEVVAGITGLEHLAGVAECRPEGCCRVRAR